jgi:cold shock CspA family protein
MQVPPEIVFKGVQTSPYVDRLIDRGIAGLEQVCDYIISTRIAVEQAEGRHLTGNAYEMRIDIRISGRPDIVVKRSSKAAKKIPDGLDDLDAEAALQSEPDAQESAPGRGRPVRRGIREEPLVALIRRTFDSAQRELKKVVEKQRGEVKTPASRQMSAVVERIVREQGYGFLRTEEGEQVYFHSNSVLHGHWENLSAGTAVRYVAEMGDKGLQASTVDVVQRIGASEGHDEFHELPPVASLRRTLKGKRQERL